MLEQAFLQSFYDHAQNYHETSARACPLCVYDNGVLIKNCVLHSRLQSQDTRIAELGALLFESNSVSGMFQKDLNDLLGTVPEKEGFGEACILEAVVARNKRIKELEAEVAHKQTINVQSCHDTCEFYTELFGALGITESTDEYKCDEEDILKAIRAQKTEITKLREGLRAAKKYHEAECSDPYGVIDSNGGMSPGPCGCDNYKEIAAIDALLEGKK